MSCLYLLNACHILQTSVDALLLKFIVLVQSGLWTLTFSSVHNMTFA